jgi:hypothetical protein
MKCAETPDTESDIAHRIAHGDHLMNRRVFALFLVVSLLSAPAFGALLLEQLDGAVPRVYANGGGGGFGGTLGNGSITMDRVGTNLVIGFNPGSALNDIVALFLDTRPGGVLDAQMSDTADGGRTAISELTLTKDDTYPAGVVPDFGLAIGNFGSVLFELTVGNTPGHLNFQIFNGAPNIVIPLSLLGNPAKIDFFAGYASGGGYNSNESLPHTTAGANQNGNPGFGDGQFGGLNQGAVYDNFDRFRTGIPEPSAVFVWGLLLAAVGLFSQYRRSL